MKTMIFILSVTFTIILVILGCSKQQSDTDLQVNSSVPMNHANHDIEKRILAFKQRIESNLKVGGAYSISEAVWNIEALVNYEYADVRYSQLPDVNLDSAFITVALSDGKVTVSEVNAVYSKVIDSLTLQYASLPATGHLIFADIFNRDSVAGSVTFGLVSSFGYGSPINYGTFGEDDWWIFGWSWCDAGGYCGESLYAGTQKHDDGAEQIERRIRLNIGVPAQRHSSVDCITLQIIPDGTVYDELGTIENDCNFLNPEDEAEGDNLFDYLMMYKYSDNPNFEGGECLTPEEMNFYWHGTEWVSFYMLNECLEEVIGEREFMLIDIVGDNDTGDPDYHYQHRMFCTWGTWVINENNPGTFD